MGRIGREDKKISWVLFFFSLEPITPVMLNEVKHPTGYSLL